MADEPDPGGRQRDGRPAVGVGAAAKQAPSAAEAGAQRLDPDIETLLEHDAMTTARPDGGPHGPDPDQVRKLFHARVERINRRRASRGLARSGWTDRDYTRQAAAQAQYLERGRTLLARYRREIGLAVADEDIDPRAFVYWLFSLKLTLKPSSWRAYRLAALARIQALPHEHRLDALGMLEGDVGAGANETRPTERNRPELDQGQSGVAKRIDRAHFDAVLAALPMFSRSKMVTPLQDWIVAGLTTGLQPSEWATAILETQQDANQPQRRRAWLHVVNIQGEHPITRRTIDISDFSDEVFTAVERMVKRATEWSLAQRFDLRRSQCTQTLAAAFAALFPQQRQRCTLDSLHHQFVHNAKLKYSRAEVAALIGYVGNDAAADHGKRRLAWPDQEIVDIPRPMAAQVTQMRKRITLYEERRQASRLRQALKERRRRHKAAAGLASGADEDSGPSK